MELQYGDEITLSPILTEGHLCGNFMNGKCYPTVTVHEMHQLEGVGMVTIPKGFERCVFSILRPVEDQAVDGVRSVTYGSCVRLSSVIANQVLQVVPHEEDSDQVGLCLAERIEGASVSLEETFRLLPKGRIREEGEVVRAGEQLLLESVSTSKYLSVGPSFSRISFAPLPNGACRPTGRGVGLSQKPSSETVWAIEAFDIQASQPDHTTGVAPLRVGDPVVLFHKEKEAFFEGGPSSVSFTPVKPPKATYSVRDVPQPSGAVWIIESNQIVTGGTIAAASLGGAQAAYRLRHLATGKYLCCHANMAQNGPSSHAVQRQRLGLVSSLVHGTEDYIDDTLISFHPLDNQDEVMKAGGYARLEMVKSGTWVHCTSDVGEGAGYTAAVAPRPIYEDLFAIHHAEYGIAPALQRVGSMLPLLKAASEIFESKSTYAVWNEVASDLSPQSFADSLDDVSSPSGSTSLREELLAAIAPLIICRNCDEEDVTSEESSAVMTVLSAAVLCSCRQQRPKPILHRTTSGLSKQQNISSVSWMYNRKLYKRRELSVIETTEAISCLGSDKLIKNTLDQLKRSAWRANLKAVISSIITVLSDLIAFVSGEVILEGVRPPNIPPSTATAVREAEELFVKKLRPVKKGQKILYEQGVHHMVYKLVSAPFTNKNITLDSVRNYDSLSVILRLGYRLITLLVAGFEQAANDLVPYISFFETQSGYRLNAADTVHAIVHDHERVLSQLKDATIKRFVNLVPSYGRSPSYLNLLSAVCETSGEGIPRTQTLVCTEVLRLQNQPGRLLHRTRLNKGALEVEILPEHSSDASLNFHTSTIFDLVTPLGDTTHHDISDWQNQQWVPMQNFIATGTYRSVKYYERQLNLMAALCAGNPECRENVSDLIPRGHILVALEKGLLSNPTSSHTTALGDAVRTRFLALARMLYLAPSGKKDPGDLVSRWKRLLCNDIKRNTSLCSPKVGRNEQVRETLKCLLLLVENNRFSQQELQKLAPILVQLLDPSTDTMDEASHCTLTSGAAKLVGYFSKKKDAATGMWQQAVVEALPKQGHEDANFRESENNKTVTGCKIVACQLLECTARQGQAMSKWVDSVETHAGVLQGSHALSKVLLEVSMYQGDDELFKVAFRLLCKSLVDDPLCAGYGDFPPEADGRENAAVVGLSSIIKQDVLHRPAQLASTQNTSGVIVRHLVSHFSNSFDDTFSVCFILRVFTHLITSEKDKGGDEAMRQMQCNLDRLGCTLLMSSLIEAPDEAIVNYALAFGIAMLEGGNLQVQAQLMSYFDSISDEAFFQCIRQKLHSAVVELKDVEVKEKRRWLTDQTGMSHRFPLSPARIGPASTIQCVTKTLRLLQLFCEGHNNELQNYIHSQPDNLHSVDLVKESLLVLKSVISVPPACYEPVLFDLLLQCFNSLTEYCQGPCKTNQEALVNAHLAKEVSTVLKLEYEGATAGRITREQTDEMQNAATITLLSLLEGCEDNKVPNMLMQNADLMLLIGSALDACWANRKRGNEEHDTALELGFNLYIFMETLSAFDEQHILADNRFFMRVEKGFMYYQAMTGRIEIAVREGRLQRVYFRVPELCLNLSETTKKRILWSVDRDTPTARILSFYSMADDALFEMKYNDSHFSRKALSTGFQQWAEKSYVAAIGTIVAVYIHRHSWGIYSCTVYISLLLSFLNAAMIEQEHSVLLIFLLYFFGTLQLLLTTASAVNKAVSEGPIMAHKFLKSSNTAGWSRRSTSPEVLLQLRQAEDPYPESPAMGCIPAPPSVNVTMGSRKGSDMGVYGSPRAPKRATPNSGFQRRVSGGSSAFMESPNMQPARLNVPNGRNKMVASPLRLDTRYHFDTSPQLEAKDILFSSCTEKLGSSLTSSRKEGVLSNTLRGLRRVPKPDPLMRCSDNEDDEGLGYRTYSSGVASPAVRTPRRMSDYRPSPITSPEITGKISKDRDKHEPNKLLPPDQGASSESTPSPNFASPCLADDDFSYEIPGLMQTKGRNGISPRARRGSPHPMRPIFSQQVQQDSSQPESSRLEGDFHSAEVLLCLLKDAKFLAQCFMVLCSVLGLFVSPLFFTSQLFSIVANSPILQSVIRSITKNGKSLLLTGLLAVIIVYHFAVAGFMFFRSSYQDSGETTATIFRTFVHTLFKGIAAGGISELLHPPKFDVDGDGAIDTMYGLRMAFEFSFYVVVIVILLNIIFGIIIDTFAELRAEKQKVEEEIRTKCFICGIESSEFDRHAMGFECHIKRDHNMWFYIYFIHHLRTKDQSEFTGQESFVWNRMQGLDLSFFPSNKAISLQDKGTQQEEQEDAARKQPSVKPNIPDTKYSEVWSELRAQSRKIDLIEKKLREVLPAFSALVTELKRSNGNLTVPVLDESPHNSRLQRNRSAGSFRFPDIEPKPAISRHASLCVTSNGKGW